MIPESILNQALYEFSNIDFNNSDVANTFFERFGVGNSFTKIATPFERFSYYESLLDELLGFDYEKYQIIHKGTPFYIMAWLAFDLKNFEKALYYIDAAISEDVKNSDGNWTSLPASYFLTLVDNSQVAQRTIDFVRHRLDSEFSRFNIISGSIPLNIDTFISRFVIPLLQDAPKRTIISAFYVFLLEYTERMQELQMRSTEGGSIAPFLLHLFSGALIFETLLKHLFPIKNNGDPTRTLGDIFNTTSFIRIFPRNISTSANSFVEILSGITDETILTAFTTTAKIRNTTGHNLIWDDTFANPTQYQRLFHQEVNSILYLIDTCF